MKGINSVLSSSQIKLHHFSFFRADFVRIVLFLTKIRINKKNTLIYVHLYILLPKKIDEVREYCSIDLMTMCDTQVNKNGSVTSRPFRKG